MALAGLWLVYAAFGATTASLAPLIPEIRADLETTNTALGLTLGAWPLVYIVAAIPAGAVLDAFGPRKGLLIATLVIALSAGLRALADTPTELMLAVGLFGIGGPLISVGAPKLIASLFDGAARGTAIGIYITGPNVGAIVTLMTTNSLLLPAAGSWQGVMLFHAGAALCAGLIWLAVSGLARVSATSPNRERFDLGALRTIVTNADVLIVLSMSVGVFYINHALNNWLPAILRSSGMDAARAGVWAAVPTLVGLAAALTIPRFATAPRRLPILIGLFAAACLASLLIAAGPGQGQIAGLLVQGLVRGSLMSVATLVLIELPAIPRERIGLASGAFFAAGEIGGVLGPFSFGTLRDLTGGFTVPLHSITVLSLGMVGLVLVLMRRKSTVWG